MRGHYKRINESIKKMKAVFICVLLAAVAVSLDAAPSTIQLYKNSFKVLTLTEAGKGKLHDIWSDCSSSSDPAKIITIVITPDPPQRGVTLNLNATITLNEVVTGGQIEIKLKYGIFPAIDQKLDLCTTLKQGGKSCPLQTGTQSLTVAQSIPSAAPGGHYTGNAYVRDQSGKELVCIALNFHL